MKSMVAWCAGFLQNRLPVSGHALFLAYRVQPQTVFQECKKKKKKKQTRTRMAWPIFSSF